MVSNLPELKLKPSDVDVWITHCCNIGMNWNFFLIPGYQVRKSDPRSFPMKGHSWKLLSLGYPVLWPGQHLGLLTGTFIVIILAYVGEACSASKDWTQRLLLAFVILLCNYLTVCPKPWTIGIFLKYYCF